MIGASAADRNYSSWPGARPILLLAAVMLVSLAGPAQAGPGDDAPVAAAASRDDAAEVRELIRGGADVNAAQGDGMTALHWAALHGDASMARMLLYAGASVRAATRIGAYTPLLVASRYGQAEVIEVLAAAGADVDAAAATGAMPLMLAAGSGNADAVSALLAHGADPNARDAAQGQTALMFAASRDAVAAIDLLVGAGADIAIQSEVVDVVAREKAAGAAFRRKRKLAAAIASVDAPEPEADAAEAATNELKGDDGKNKPDTLVPAEAAAPEGGEGAAADDAPSTSAADAAAAELQSREDPETSGDPKTSDESAAEAANAVGGDKVTSSPPGAEPEPTPPVGSTEESAAGASPVDAGAGAAEPGEAGTRPKEDENARLVNSGRLSFGQLVGKTGGMTALLHAARQGYTRSVRALLELGADVSEVSGGDHTSPLLIAVINGHFDLALELLEQGADPNLASEAGATPLYAALNVEWAPKTLYPQPRAYAQQRHAHIELMRALLEAGAEPNVRLEKKIWYSGYNFDLSGVNEVGATPFWRAAYASDVPAMKLLREYGADPDIPTTKPAGRPRTGDATREVEDVSGLPPVPVGGPGVPPLLAAAGVGYGEGFAANSHRNAPGGWLPAVRYLVEECGADVNAVDHEGNTALHMAAARGDNEMIRYLVAHGADVTRVNREGNTTADMANGPVQRTQPFPETIELLVSLGAVNNDKCVSC